MLKCTADYLQTLWTKLLWINWLCCRCKIFPNQTCEHLHPDYRLHTSLESSTKTHCNFLHIFRLPKANLLNNKLLPPLSLIFSFRPPLMQESCTHSLCISKHMVRDRYWYSHANWLIMEVVYLNWERNLPGVKMTLIYYMIKWTTD